MPTSLSASKRVRQIAKRTERNRIAKSRLKTVLRRFFEAVESKDEAVQQRLFEAIRTIDKSASKGIIHKNTAARRKARLNRIYNSYMKEMG